MLTTETGLLAGYGFDAQGPYLSIDERASEPWQRTRLRPLGKALTLRASNQRYCTGRYDLAASCAQPCPLKRAMADTTYTQCAECMRATGFNPAFYNAVEISPQQRAYNAGGHLVYLANFGRGLLKVGITHERRGMRRLLEQGARAGVILSRFDDAYAARELEAQIAAQFDVAETVRASRKRKLLVTPFRFEVASQELLRMVDRIAELRPDIDCAPTVLQLDARYGSLDLSSLSAVDLSGPPDGEVAEVTGDCRAMVGDILVVEGRRAQVGTYFMCSLGALVGRAVEICDEVGENRVTGQLALPF